MHIYAQIIDWAIAAAKRGEIDLNAEELAAFGRVRLLIDVSEETGLAQFRQLLGSQHKLARASGRVLVRQAKHFCEEQLSDFERLKKERSLTDAEKEYLLNMLLPLYNDTLRLMLKVGR